MKALLQAWLVIVIGGAVGMFALAWVSPYESGSAIDIIKTKVQQVR